LKRGLLAGIFLLAVFYGVAPLFLPSPAPASGPSEKFSAERAMLHVRALAKVKRLAGSPGMQQTTDYLVEALKTCGFDPQIQETPSKVGLLRNVVVKLEGSQPGNALLILSHPDSVSYGAGDNASGAAVLLEIARSLQAGEQLQNDIILLFDDGEELGYLEGYAFAQNHPWMSKVRRAIGLDTAAWDPVVLLQTTPGNADFIRAYARSVPNPTAFGFFAAADWSISHDTSEIQPFYEQGIPGLALEDPTAFVGKHSELDTAEKVKPGSLQQMGEQVLALARTMGEADLTQFALTDESYFTLWKVGVIHYPASANIYLAILSACGLFYLIYREIRQKKIATRSLLLAVLFILSALLGSTLLGVASTKIFGILFPNPNPKIDSFLLPVSLPFFIGVLLLTTALFLVVRNRITKHLGTHSLEYSGLFF
jgi:hypothetical protein